MIDSCNHYSSRKFWTYEEKIPENITIEEITNILKELSNRFSPNNYHLLKNNCQLYINAVLMKVKWRD